MLLVHVMPAMAADSEKTTQLDCGVNAFFILLRIEGRPVTLDRMNAVLPPRRVDGYSIAELKAAARSLGLDLDGVRFTKGDEALKRPAIAFFHDAKGGHFAVLRPVGTTGTMVQVIDPPSAPWIADYDRLFAMKPWTGRILTPSDSLSLRQAILVVMGAAGVAFLGIAFRPGLIRAWKGLWSRSSSRSRKILTAVLTTRG